MRKERAPNMYGLNKSANSAMPITDFIADSLKCIEIRPIQHGRIGRKVAEFWPFSENRQFKYRKPSKSAMPITDSIAEKIT